MYAMFKRSLLLMGLLLFPLLAMAQVDELCAEEGALPTLDAPKLSAPYIYGRVKINGLDPKARFPNVTITLIDPQQTQKRITLSRSGAYCFKRTGGSNGTLILEINGVEVDRRSFSSFGPAQQREDFEVYWTEGRPAAASAVISAKFPYTRNSRVEQLLIRAAEAEKAKDRTGAIDALKRAVAEDPKDFIVWESLGMLHFLTDDFASADAAFRMSLELRVDYTPAWVSVGKLRAAQKQVEAAIEIFKHAITLEPANASIYQLLGEAYLQARKGTLGAEALNKAIELDPFGMAECHLRLARLYDLAGAKDLAAREYRLFLEKIPNHPEREKFEKYVRLNP